MEKGGTHITTPTFPYLGVKGFDPGVDRVVEKRQPVAIREVVQGGARPEDVGDVLRDRKRAQWETSQVVH